MSAPEKPLPLEFYRSSAVGEALIQSLNEMLENGSIPESEAMRILGIFDENFQSALRAHVLLKKEALVSSAKGELASYNNIENLWKFDVKDFELQIGENESFHFDRAQFLCSEDAKLVTKAAKQS